MVSFKVILAPGTAVSVCFSAYIFNLEKMIFVLFIVQMRLAVPASL